MRGSDLIDIMKAYRFHDHWLNFVESDDIRSKLHVGHSTFNLETPIRISKREEPGKHLFETILNARVPLLRFTGQYDGIVPYQSSVHTLHILDWYCLTTALIDIPAMLDNNPVSPETSVARGKTSGLLPTVWHSMGDDISQGIPRGTVLCTETFVDLYQYVHTREREREVLYSTLSWDLIDV